MTPEEYKWKMCDKKQRFRSMKKAREMIKQIQRCKLMDNKPRIYKCPYCEGFHITKQTKNKFLTNNSESV